MSTDTPDSEVLMPAQRQTGVVLLILLWLQTCHGFSPLMMEAIPKAQEQFAREEKGGMEQEQEQEAAVAVAKAKLCQKVGSPHIRHTEQTRQCWAKPSMEAKQGRKQQAAQYSY